MFKESDDSLIFLKKFISVLSIIEVIGCFVGAIICWVLSSIELEIGGQTQVIKNNFNISMGFILFFCGPLLVWILHKLKMVAVYSLYDIKLIRNKLYDTQSPELHYLLVSTDIKTQKQSNNSEKTLVNDDILPNLEGDSQMPEEPES